ncbi:FixH family protein [Sphingopyxis soli]|uniref:FixH family protein n=1 Tax=Sphingopyxis soli TaxID=592051 RepID=A0ABP3X4Z6_9SPHN|nr:FixH family protein [Sphingopyxis soli]
MREQTRAKSFTGRHMTIILVAFFGVVIAVNFTMARLASSTFGGTVVDNSYVASQQYNEWLARAAAQDRLGWDTEMTVDSSRYLLLAVRKEGVPLGNVQAVATVHHPLGRTAPVTLRFESATGGALRSTRPLAAGRWRLDLVVRHGAAEARYREDVR